MIAHNGTMMNGGVTGLNVKKNHNRDAVLSTMGELLLEIGQLFQIGQIQDLTTTLKGQLDELQSNSNHIQRVDSNYAMNAGDSGNDEDTERLDQMLLDLLKFEVGNSLESDEEDISDLDE